jgi:dihydroflavonol-4-reductase
MRAFVTGASGFVGTNLIRELVAQQWDVVALHRNPPRHPLDPKVTLAQGDVTDLESLRRAIPEGVDVVFHVAGDTSMWSRQRQRQFDVNVTGTGNAAKVALEKRVRRFVHTSSIAAYGRHPQRITEETPSNAIEKGFNYEKTKRGGELMVDEAIANGLDAVIINPANIVGPYDTSNWGNLVRLVAQEKLPGIPPGAASWCHVREVARAHIAAADRGRTGHRYLLGGTDATYAEAVQTIGAIAGKRVPKKPTSAAVLRTLAVLFDLASHVTRRQPDLTPDSATIVCSTIVCDTGKAVRELGYRPVSLREMFTDCYEWMRSERIIP